MPNESSDVLNQFRQGNPDAFEALFRLHHRAVYGWILRVVRNPATAEELTVETFWRIHRAHGRFESLRWGSRAGRGTASRHGWLWTGCGWRGQDGRRASYPRRCLLKRPRRATSDPAVTAEIRLKMALAFGRLPPKLRITATLAVVEEAAAKMLPPRRWASQLRPSNCASSARCACSGKIWKGWESRHECAQ